MKAKIYPMGEQACVVDYGAYPAEQAHGMVMALSRLLQARPFSGMIEDVPAYVTLTIYYDPVLVGREAVKRSFGTEASAAGIRPGLYVGGYMMELAAGLESPVTDGARETARLVEIPVCYGGDAGPDLGEVARYCGMPEDDVIRLHGAARYCVYMIGFVPGFPYLGGMSERIAAPRRAVPRKAVPPGSVGIAGRQTGVYPIATPGGWQIIGRTPLRLFRPESVRPSLLQAGDEVRFVPISRESYETWQEERWAGGGEEQ